MSIEQDCKSYTAVHRLSMSPLLSKFHTVPRNSFNSILFTSVRKVRPFLCLFSQQIQKLSGIVFKSFVRNFTHTYLLTAWCRVLLEKLTGLQLVKKFPAFHGTPRFITALTSVRQLSLSWTSPIQSTYPHPTSWRSILILSTHLRLGLPSGLFLSGFPTKTLYTPSPHPYVPHALPISFFSILPPAQYWARSTNHLGPRYAISTTPPLPLSS